MPKLGEKSTKGKRCKKPEERSIALMELEKVTNQLERRVETPKTYFVKETTRKEKRKRDGSTDERKL